MLDADNRSHRESNYIIEEDDFKEEDNDELPGNIIKEINEVDDIEAGNPSSTASVKKQSDSSSSETQKISSGSDHKKEDDSRILKEDNCSQMKRNSSSKNTKKSEKHADFN